MYRVTVEYDEGKVFTQVYEDEWEAKLLARQLKQAVGDAAEVYFEDECSEYEAHWNAFHGIETEEV